MYHLKKHTVLTIQTALRAAQHPELAQLVARDRIDWDDVWADLTKHYDENGNYVGAAGIAECPECGAEVQVR